MRTLVSIALAICLAGFAVAQQESLTEKVDLQGKLICAKCDLEEAGSCQLVLVVDKRGKQYHFYFQKNDVYKKFEGLGDLPEKVRVKGTLELHEGRAWVEAKSIEPAR